MGERGRIAYTATSEVHLYPFLKHQQIRVLLHHFFDDRECAAPDLCGLRRGAQRGLRS